MTLSLSAVCDWDNLWRAAHAAALGKRRKRSAAEFEFHLADNLLALQRELETRSYQPGPYHNFFIHEPKRRKISAAPFRDRVVHHALCNVIMPVFEQRFIPDSYANRVGKGTHAAINRLQHFAGRYLWVLRMDVVQHFPSLDHAVLRAELARVIDDSGLMWLIDVILNSGAGVLADEYTPAYFDGDTLLDVLRPRGLPIGNLTSQFWSNVYMNPFDHFVSRELGCRAYLRYVDDFALFSNSKTELVAWRERIIARLARLRLTCHEPEAQALQTRAGIPWLGFVVYPDHRLLKRRNVVKFSRRLRQNVGLYAKGQISRTVLDASVRGWIAHVDTADTWGLRGHIFGDHAVPRGPT
jgi:RNA-directed DNA polymerase